MTPHPRSARKKELKRARQIRSEITLESQRLHDGEITLRDVLEDPEAFSLGRCQVHTLLRRSPKLGEKGAKKCLLEAGVWPLTRVVELSKYDREEIVKCLPSRVI